MGRLHRMGKTSLKPYGGARDRPGRWQSRPRRAQKGPARRGKRARGVDAAEREKWRLEATCHPRNVAHVGRSMRSAYVGGWGGCSRSQVERFCLLVKSRYNVHVAYPSGVKGPRQQPGQACCHGVWVYPSAICKKFLPARRRQDARGLDPKGSGPLCVRSRHLTKATTFALTNLI